MFRAVGVFGFPKVGLGLTAGFWNRGFSISTSRFAIPAAVGLRLGFGVEACAPRRFR